MLYAEEIVLKLFLVAHQPRLPTSFSDCWYFYALNPLDRVLSGRIDTEPDQTIEILMTELDPKVMELFTKSKAKNGPDATKVCFRLHHF